MNCRSCNGSLIEVMNLGNLPISDFLVDIKDISYAPLEIMMCSECGLVQLNHTVSRDRLYKGTYWYRSGTNESMVNSLRDIVLDVSGRVDLQRGDYILDIGCNDGTMLNFYPRWVNAVGYEPSGALAKIASWNSNADVINSYFPGEWHGDHRKYKIITSIAQFYNVDDINAYVAAIKEILHQRGLWCIQMAYLPETLKSNNLGDFCHEHLTFWTVDALSNLLKRYGLGIAHLSFNQTNGGSIRAMIGHNSYCVTTDRITLEEFTSFARRVDNLKAKTVTLLESRKPKLVIGLGASTKNNTVLSYYGIGPELIPYFAERQTEKVGRHTVTGIPIIGEEEARVMNPDYYFIGPFHFLNSLMAREQEFLRRGGKFIVPFPELQLVGRNYNAYLQSQDTQAEVRAGYSA